MRTIRFLSLLLAVIGMSMSCSAQTNDTKAKTEVSSSNQIAVYYFHYSRRCATCEAVESVSKETIQELYGTKVNFADYNLDEDEGEKVGEQLDVSGQTLLIVSGDTKINITNEAFMNARNNPEKLKHLIKEKVDGLMN